MRFERLFKILLYAMIALVPFKVEFEIYGAVMTPLDIVIYLLVSLTIIRYFLFPQKINIKYSMLFFLFYLFIIPSKIPLLHPKSLIQGIWHIFRNIFEPLPLIFLLIIFNLRDKKSIKKAILILIISSTISSMIGIAQTLSNGRYLTGIGVYGNFKYLGIYPPLPSDSDPLGKGHLGKVSVITHVPNSNIFRAHGGLSRHNYFGAFLVLVVAITISLSLNGNSKFYLAFLFQLFALTLAFSRASYIGFILSLCLVCLIERSIKKIFKIGIIIVLCLAIPLVFVPSEISKQVIKRFETIFKLQEQIEVTSRTQAFKIAIAEILKKPFFGHGVGGLKGFEIQGYSLTSHNDILDIMYTRGIIAFIILYFIYFQVLKDSFLYWKYENDHELWAYVVGFFAGFIGFLISGLAQSISLMPDTSSLIWTSMGLRVSLMKSVKESEGEYSEL